MDNYQQLKDVYSDELKYFGLFDKGNNLVGSFCYYGFNKLWQKHIITPPFLTDIQLRTNCTATNSSQISNFNRDVLSSISHFLKQQPHSYLEIVLPHHIKDGLSFNWDGFKVGVRYTYLLDLNLQQDELLSNMSTQRRKNIRDAEKHHLEIREINDTTLISAKAIETLSSKNAKFNEQVVKNFAALADTESLTNIGVYENGELSALSTAFNSNNESTYLFGWNNGESGRSFLGTFALWQCILASQKTSSTFNFAGSQLPSIEKYFRGFGGTLTPMLSIVSDKRKLMKQFT